MDSIQELVEAEKLAKRMDKLNQRHCLRIFERLNKEENDLRSSERAKSTNDLSSLASYYEHRVLDLSDLPLARADRFHSQHCLFCKDKSKKMFKLRSFKEDRKRTTFLFKICSACGKWEKLQEAKMVKVSGTKRKSGQSNRSNESIKLSKFNLQDLKQLKSTLKKNA